MTQDITEPLLTVGLLSIRYAARDTHIFEFEQTNGQPLPAVDPGAHIDVHLPIGLVRQYSLINYGSAPRTFSLAVKRDPASRGGSTYMNNRLSVGDILQIGMPRNNFPLALDAPASVFIAGGIGITPIFCMTQRLTELEHPWQLYYACRSRADAAFAADLERSGAVTFHFDDEKNGQFLDVAAVTAAAPAGSHLYCCGPTPMLRSFEAATAHLDPERVHVEYFSPAEIPAIEGGFVVELARSKQEFYVPKGKTILDVLQDAGVSVPHSCESGVCGSCETRVLAGQPDHRDSILDERERAESKTMMLCCSGSKSDRLVLDL